MASKLPKAPEQQEPLQFAFLETNDDRLTKSYGLWDLIPWPVIYTSESMRRGEFLKSIERTFEANGERYRLTIRPARFDRGGEEVEEYPGEIEHVIELAIRKLAAREGAFRLNQEGKIGVRLRVFDLHRELETNGHTCSYSQIENALVVMRNAHFQLQRVRTRSDGTSYEQVMLSNILPNMFYEKELDVDAPAMVYLEVNSLLAEAIRNLDFHDMNYTKLMKLKAVSRWIYKTMHRNVVVGEASSPNVTMAASVIRDACSLHYAEERRVYRKIAEYLAELTKAGVIDSISEEIFYEKVGRTKKKVDVHYHIVLTDTFLRQALQARAGNVVDLETFRAISGGKSPGEGWSRPEGGAETAKATVRSRRAKKADQAALPLLDLCTTAETVA